MCKKFAVRNGEKLEALPLRLGRRHLFSTVFEVLTRAVRQGNKRDTKRQKKKTQKTPLFAEDITLYLKDSKCSTTKHAELINIFSKVAE